jgi:hypothetical protein
MLSIGLHLPRKMLYGKGKIFVTLARLGASEIDQVCSHVLVEDFFLRFVLIDSMIGRLVFLGVSIGVGVESVFGGQSAGLWIFGG